MDLLESKSAGQSRHPWETARFQFFYDLLKNAGTLHQPVDLLDVGAGDGWFSGELSRHLPKGSKVTCWDSGYDAHAALPEFSSPGIIMKSISTRPTDRYDVILLLDVLEHVDTDESFLTELVEKNLKRNGTVLISVPCWPGLFSSHDRFLKHVRRYTFAQARQLMRKSHLSIGRQGGLFFSLLPLRFFQVVADKLGLRKGVSHHLGNWRHGMAVTRLVGSALSADARISALFSDFGWSIPGLSWWALCQRQPS